MSDSVRPHRWQPTRLPHPWDSPGKNTGVGCHFLLQGMKMKNESEVAQSCPTPSDPMGCSLPGSSVHGIFQARVLEWGAIAFSGKIVSGQQILETLEGCRNGWEFLSSLCHRAENSAGSMTDSIAQYNHSMLGVSWATWLLAHRAACPRVTARGSGVTA